MKSGLAAIGIALLLLLFTGEQYIIMPLKNYTAEESAEAERRVVDLLLTIPMFQYVHTEDTKMHAPESSNIYALSRMQSEQAKLLYTEQTEKLLAEGELPEETITNPSATSQEPKQDTSQEAIEEISEEEIQVLPNESVETMMNPVMKYDLSQFQDFSLLLKEFYTIDSTTTAFSEQLNIANLTSYNLTVPRNTEEPIILVYHTHSQEGFADSTPGDKKDTIVGAGEKLAETLRTYGYTVLHHTGEYDKEKRDYAYTYAEPAIQELLDDNPSIQVIIDLHRDEVAEGTKLLTEENGVKMAKVMFFNGLSYVNRIGKVDYLPNPNQMENLAFSFQAQVKANEYYPGFTRKIYLRGYRYNMHFRGKSMLIELGAQTNTVEEIMNAIDPLSHVIAMTLGYEMQ